MSPVAIPLRMRRERGLGKPFGRRLRFGARRPGRTFRHGRAAWGFRFLPRLGRSGSWDGARCGSCPNRRPRPGSPHSPDGRPSRPPASVLSVFRIVCEGVLACDGQLFVYGLACRTCMLVLVSSPSSSSSTFLRALRFRHACCPGQPATHPRTPSCPQHPFRTTSNTPKAITHLHPSLITLPVCI